MPTPVPTLAPTKRPNIRVPEDETPAPRGSLPSANTSSLSGRTRSALGGANPAFFVGFAALCMAFMALWASRRRRTDGDGGMSGMTTTSSHESGAAKEANNAASTASAGKYSRIENRSEDPFDEEDDDSFEYGARTGDWDDWEGETDDHDDRDDTRQLTKGMSSSSSSSPSAVLPSYAPQSVSLSLSPSPPPSQRRDTEGSRLKEILLSDSPQKSTSVASNSSNESFEVLLPTADLLSGGSLTPTKTAAQTVSAPEDDLFSQFGMVPTFKNGVQQPQVSVSSTPGARSSTSSPFTTPPASQRTAPGPAIGATALAASTLFAADDSLAIATADAADEWGEGDDDWAQDI
ncbi:hypothetical protein PINS_up011756 [Pythium insidiosum]|nr:hypothetical protein PINS_up011756 [Pythium insidiosum]